MLNSKIVPTVIAMKIQQAVLIAVKDRSDCDIRNLSEVIAKAIEEIVFVYQVTFRGTDPLVKYNGYERCLEQFKHDSVRRFADAVNEKQLQYNYQWNPSPEAEFCRLNEITFGAIDMNAIDKILRGFSNPTNQTEIRGENEKL